MTKKIPRGGAWWKYNGPSIFASVESESNIQYIQEAHYK